MGIVALVLLAWQAARIPLEGSVATSLAHARSVRGLEESLGLDVEGPVVRFASTAPYEAFSNGCTRASTPRRSSASWRRRVCTRPSAT